MSPSERKAMINRDRTDLLRFSSSQIAQLQVASGGHCISLCSNNPHIIEVGVFFDGTGNNQRNTQSDPPEGDGWTASYDNAETNISRLSRIFPNGTHRQSGNQMINFHRYYIEGIGTTSGKFDDVIDNATGTGDTGVSSRVRDACVILRQLARHHANQSGSNLQTIKLSVFGFSRGAAAARYFVNCVNGRVFEEVTSGFPLFDPEPTTLSQVDLSNLPNTEIRFLGIFETVGAIVYMEEIERLSNGERENHALEDAPRNSDNQDVLVHLREASAQNIVHLVAGDEHRANFSLSSIRDSNGNGPGEEIEIPGAHSDIGGGYAAGPEALIPIEPVWGGDNGAFSLFSDEDVEVTSFDSVRQRDAARQQMRANFHRFAERMRHSEIAERDPSEFHYARDDRVAAADDRGPQYFGLPVWLRPSVRLGTEKLCLHLMHFKARQAGVPFRPLSNLPATSWEVPQDLEPILLKLKQGNTLSESEKKMMRRLFSHWSANFGRRREAELSTFHDFTRSNVYPNRPAPNWDRLIHPNNPDQAR